MVLFYVIAVYLALAFQVASEGVEWEIPSKIVAYADVISSFGLSKCLSRVR